MKQLKKVLLLTFALAVIISVFVMAEIPSSAATYSGTCGDNLTWSLDTETGVLAIDGTGDMYDYSSESYIGSYRTTAPWKYYISNINSVVIGDFVTSIGDFSFYYCDSLSSVTMPKHITSIGNQAFSYTDYSSNSSNWIDNGLYIGNHLIKAKGSGHFNIKKGTLTIADSAFDSLNITSVTIPDTVTHIGDYAFHFCRSLSSVTIPDSVVSIGEGAFSGKLNYTMGLASVSIGKSVKSIGDYAFYCCFKLTDVIIPNSVTSIGNYAFNYCTSLTNITIGNSVARIGNYAFAGDSYKTMKLNNIIIPNSVENIGNYAFSYCTSLTSVTIGNSVKNIGSNAFYHCTSLTSVVIPKSVTSIGGSAFHYHNYGTLYKLNLTIFCYENSYAHTYAADNRFEYELMCDHIFTNYVADNNATCTSDATMTATCQYGCGTVDVKIIEGTKKEHTYTPQLLVTPTCTVDGKILYLCTCGYNYIEEVPMLEHKYGEWTVLLMSTLDTVGFEERKCSVCSTTEQRVIPVLEYVNPFTDVKESAWFYSSVEFVVKKGYMNGISATKFSPNTNITREQFVLILANISGVDTNEFKTISSGFKDVPTGKWYSGAVTWAVREGYVSGVSADKFGLGQSIQRAALARMLYNYASKNGINVEGRANLSAFGDAKEFDKAGNAWMKEPIQWAVDAGIISGMKVNGANCVNPKGTATRAQAARMLMQFDSIT